MRKTFKKSYELTEMLLETPYVQVKYRQVIVVTFGVGKRCFIVVMTIQFGISNVMICDILYKCSEIIVQEVINAIIRVI